MIATWASIIGKDLTRSRRFPLKTQIGSFGSEQQLIEWFTNWKPSNSKEAFYDYCLIDYWPLIFTPLVQELLQRHFYLKQYHIFSFGQNYDELPAIFIDGIDIIESAIAAAMKDKKNDN